MTKRIFPALKVSLLALVFLFGVSYVLGAWTNPTKSPPFCNPTDNPGCSPPINAGPTAQEKTGELRIATDSGAKVGIGMIATPLTKKLEVLGDILVNGVTVGRGKNDVVTNTAVGADALKSNTSGVSNTAVGMNALFNNTTTSGVEGSYNTATGHNALYNNTTGYQNTATGYRALNSNTTGYFNTAVGKEALYGNTTGYLNTAVGYLALLGVSGLSTGSNNTAVGPYALYANTTGSYNTASGVSALSNNIASPNNTAVGYQALQSNNSILGNNTAVGYQALKGNTSGSYNTATGQSALSQNTYGASNIATGVSALSNNDTGSFNTAVGKEALYGNTTGGLNTAIGYQALYENTSIGGVAGTHNTAAGYRSLYSNTTGQQNTAIGYNADVLSGNFTNATAIGAGAIVRDSNRVRVGNSSVTKIEGQVPWSSTSDARLKENIIDYTFGLNFITKLRPVKFNFKSDSTRKIHSGFVAQEVEAIGIPFYGLDKPETKNGYYTLSYAEFVVPLVNAVKELKQENDDLRARLAALEAKSN